MTRYRGTLENLLVTDFLRLTLFRRMYLQAITAVRTAIEMAADLDAALAEVLAGPLAFDGGA